MVKKKKNDANKFLNYFGKGLLFIIKIPYYLIKGIYNLIKKVSEKIKSEKIAKKRKDMNSKYESFKVVRVIAGDYNKWFDKTIKSDSQIGIILGARGTGKTAFGIKFLENIHSKENKKCFAMGFKKEEMPYWINVVENISDISNNSLVLIDEGGILFNSRNSMSNANKMLSSLIMIARHKNISILFISQNSSNLEINILRQADFLVLKPSSLLQKEFERKIIQKIYLEIGGQFKEFENDKSITHIYSDYFKGFVSNPLPSFWNDNVSKGFK